MSLPPDRLDPDTLLAAYAAGYFPMARSRSSPRIDWYVADPRGILPLDGFHVPRRLRRTLRQSRFEVSADTAFEAVVRGCAGGRVETWINAEIVRAYSRLHALGHAHSVEARLDGQLVGGVYGVALGAAFFAESMYHRADLGGTDASKVALVHLVETLRAGAFKLLDIQMVTPATERFGAVEIPLPEYHKLLSEALDQDADFLWPPRTHRR